MKGGILTPAAGSLGCSLPAAGTPLVAPTGSTPTKEELQAYIASVRANDAVSAEQYEVLVQRCTEAQRQQLVGVRGGSSVGSRRCLFHALSPSCRSRAPKHTVEPPAVLLLLHRLACSGAARPPGCGGARGGVRPAHVCCCQPC